jgi:hypothetical protein
MENEENTVIETPVTQTVETPVETVETVQEPEVNVSETTETPAPEVHEEVKKKKSIDDRIAELKKQTYVAREAQRQAQETQRQLEETRQRIEHAQTQALKEPNIDNYQTTQEYQQAINQYVDQKSKIEAARMANEHLRQQNQQNAIQKTVATWQFKKEQAIAKDPTFIQQERQVESALRAFNSHPIIEQSIIESDISTELVTYLGLNPEVMERVAQSHPGNALKELGRIEAQLSAKVKKVNTPLPTPPSGIPSGSGAPAGYSNLSFADFERKRNEEMKGRR